jgi:hypothetical protein
MEEEEMNLAGQQHCASPIHVSIAMVECSSL